MSAAYSIQCPSCSNSFLATQSLPSTILSCPHCSFSGPLAQFAATRRVPLPGGRALPMRRREVRHRDAPVNSAVPPFAVRQVNSNAPAPHSPVLPAIPELLAPSSALVQTPSPTFNPHLLSQRPQPALVKHGQSPQATLNHTNPVEYPPLSQYGSLPHGAPPSSRFRWKVWLVRLTVLALVLGPGIWIWWDGKSETRANFQADIAAATSVTEVIRRAEPAIPPIPADLPEGLAALPFTDENVSEEETTRQLAEEGPDHLRQWFAAQRDQQVLWIIDGEKYRESVSRFFDRDPRVTLIQTLAVPPVDLITGAASPIFQVNTSLSPSGALAKLVREPGGGWQLDWPLFEETHDGTLSLYIENKSDTRPHWFHAGIRRNHGLELDAETRATHHCFLMQASATIVLPVPAIVKKELPSGRHLDRHCQWEVTHLTRLLLQKRVETNGILVLDILDHDRGRSDP